MIERKRYLELCQKYAVVCKNDKSEIIKKDFVVQLNGNDYFPISYVLSFGAKGECIHGAVLQDLNSNSIATCLLKDISELDK